MSQEKRRIFVLYTGGTIGMVQSGRGLRPDAALAEKALLPFSDGLFFAQHLFEVAVVEDCYGTGLP